MVEIAAFIVFVWLCILAHRVCLKRDSAVKIGFFFLGAAIAGGIGFVVIKLWKTSHEQIAVAPPASSGERSPQAPAQARHPALTLIMKSEKALSENRPMDAARSKADAEKILPGISECYGWVKQGLSKVDSMDYFGAIHDFSEANKILPGCIPDYDQKGVRKLRSERLKMAAEKHADAFILNEQVQQDRARYERDHISAKEE